MIRTSCRRLCDATASGVPAATIHATGYFTAPFGQAVKVGTTPADYRKCTFAKIPDTATRFYRIKDEAFLANDYVFQAEDAGRVRVYRSANLLFLVVVGAFCWWYDRSTLAEALSVMDDVVEDMVRYQCSVDKCYSQRGGLGLVRPKAPRHYPEGEGNKVLPQDLLVDLRRKLFDGPSKLSSDANADAAASCGFTLVTSNRTASAFIASQLNADRPQASSPAPKTVEGVLDGVAIGLTSRCICHRAPSVDPLNQDPATWTVFHALRRHSDTMVQTRAFKHMSGHSVDIVSSFVDKVRGALGARGAVVVTLRVCPNEGFSTADVTEQDLRWCLATARLLRERAPGCGVVVEIPKQGPVLKAFEADQASFLHEGELVHL